MTDRLKRRNGKRTRALQCEVKYIPTGIIYKSMREAGKETGVATATVHRHCRGQCANPMYEIMSELDIQDNNSCPNVEKLHKSVIFIPTGTWYPSLKAAAKQHGIAYQTIWEHCRGNTKRTVQWRYAKELNNG